LYKSSQWVRVTIYCIHRRCFYSKFKFPRTSAINRCGDIHGLSAQSNDLQQGFPITVASEIAPRLEIVSTSNNLITLKIRGLQGFQYLLQRSDLISNKWILDPNAKIISTEGFEKPVEQIVNISDNEAMFFRLDQTR
jgi:hypothetical protein